MNGTEQRLVALENEHGLDDGEVDVRAATGDLGVDELDGRSCQTEEDRARRRARACAEMDRGEEKGDQGAARALMGRSA
jgi:hypothetical protein